MNRLWLILEARRDVVFTAQAATSGGHETLPHIPGNSLLGWAAARLYRTLPPADAFTLFHSGTVRFGTGWPLTMGGMPAFPAPLIWRETKRGKGGVDDSLNKNPSVVCKNIRHADPAFRDDQFKEQTEILKGWYIAADGSAVRPERGTRGKTAIEPGTGRAAEGQYFAYEYLKSGSRFAALIEADAELDPGLWQQIKCLFTKAKTRGLRLGRSAGTEFGGDFSVTVQSYDAAHCTPFPSLSRDPQDHKTARLWCLSDLALEDPLTLTPCTIPTGAAFGLGTGRFIPEKSAIATRRYAPFNLKLDRPDLDRCVIAGGSVLFFDGLDRSDYQTLLDLVERGAGLYREAGLGRLWLDPPALATARPDFATRAGTVSFPTPGPSRSNAHPAPYAAMINAVASWAKAHDAAATATDARHEQASRHADQLKHLLNRLSAAGQPIPARSQWATLSAMCRDGTPLSKLLHPETGFLKRPEWRSSLLGTLADDMQRSLLEWFNTYPKTQDRSAEILALTADLIHKHLGQSPHEPV